jgi:hypothetical protein
MEWAPLGASRSAYNSWKECYDERFSLGMMDSRKTKIEEFMNNGGYNFLSGVEEKFECASICDTGKFFMSRPLSEGRPTKDCMRAWVNDM